MTKASIPDVIGRALDALEPDATAEQRRDSFNELRDLFFPADWTMERVASLPCAADAYKPEEGNCEDPYVCCIHKDSRSLNENAEPMPGVNTRHEDQGSGDKGAYYLRRRKD